ncbi:MAG: hypothetical protein WCB04_09550 [Mycobacteriales bacterium]
MPALIHSAYVAVQDPSLKARLAAALARAWAYGGDAQRAIGLADEAVEISVELDDPELVADALDAALLTRWGPDDFAERVALSARLTDATAHLHATEPRLSAHLWRLTTAWECLDVVTVNRQLRALDILAAESDSPRVAFFAAARRAMSCLVAGEIDEADHLAARTEALGTQAAEPDLRAVMHSLAADRARYLGEQQVLAAEAEAFEAYGADEGIPSVSAEAAVLWLEAGHPDRALALLHRVVGPGLDAIARDVDFLLTTTCLVAVASALGVRDVATDGVRLLEPYAGRGVLTAGAVSFHGVVDDYLHRAYRLVDPTQASGWRHSAVSCYQRIGADWWRAQLQARSPAPPSQPASRANLFRNLDGTWTVGFAGASTTLADLRGMHYLHQLLAHPGARLDADRLSATAHGHSDHVAVETNTGEVIDAQALTAYRQRLADIESELDEAESWSDVARAERLSTEREALLDEVRASTGLSGRTRRFGSSQERARVAVRKAIVAALDRIGQHDGALGRHLRDTVHTGSTCYYDPDPDRPITWVLKSVGAQPAGHVGRHSSGG